VETVIEFERGVSHAARGGVRGGRGKESWAMQGRQRKNLNPERVNKVLKKPPRRVRPSPPTASRTPHHRYTIQHGRTRDNTNKHHEEPHKREGHAEAVAVFRRSRLAQKPSCCRDIQAETLRYHQDTQKCTRALWCVWVRTTLVSNCSRGRWQ
jgi:hypothetical protein